MTTKKSSRFALPDLLKGIAVLLMVQVHITELFATPEFYTSLPGRISLFLGGVPAAPLFMAVMGFFISRSNDSLKKQLFRGIKLVFAGLLLNIGLNFHLLFLVFTDQSVVDPLPYIFGVDILFLAGISIILMSFLKKLLKENIVIWAVIALLVAATGKYLHPVSLGNPDWLKYLLSYFYGTSWWSYFPLFPWFFYVLSGFVFEKIFRKLPVELFSVRNRIYFMIVTLVIIIPGFLYAFRITSNLELYYHHGLIFALWALAFLLFILLGFSFIKYQSMIFMQWVGQNVTAFYIVQWLIIGNLATAIYKTQQPLALVAWYFVVVMVTTLLVWIWEKRKTLL